MGLKVLMEWCDEWSVEVNVEKSGVMHMKRKGVMRTVERLYICWWQGDRSGGGVQVPGECGKLVSDQFENGGGEKKGGCEST